MVDADPANLVVAVIAAALALADIFAIVQTTSSLAQFLASNNRCGRRIIGAFDLRVGIWFSINTMTANSRNRMPVVSMPQLWNPFRTMEQHGTFSIDDMNFRPGQNFDSKLNCYIDGKRSRILGPGAPGYKTLNKSLTFMHYTVAIIWAPLGMALSLAIWVICCPCCYCAASRVRHKKNPAIVGGLPVVVVAVPLTKSWTVVLHLFFFLLKASCPTKIPLAIVQLTRIFMTRRLLA